MTQHPPLSAGLPGWSKTYLLGENTTGGGLGGVTSSSLVHELFTGVRLFAAPWTSPPGSSVRGILLARTLEGAAISFSRGSSQGRDQTWVSHVTGTTSLLEPPGKRNRLITFLAKIVLHTGHRPAQNAAGPGGPLGAACALARSPLGEALRHFPRLVLLAPGPRRQRGQAPSRAWALCPAPAETALGSCLSCSEWPSYTELCPANFLLELLKRAWRHFLRFVWKQFCNFSLCYAARFGTSYQTCSEGW